MKRIGLKYTGPLLDPSGYGQAARGYVHSILKHPHLFDLKTQYWNYEPKDPNTYGPVGGIIKELSQKESDYECVVVHCVPNKVMKRREEGKFMIGLNTWETDKLPPHWVGNINSAFDLQIVPSEYNKEVYKNSGVKIPIEVAHHAIDLGFIKNVPIMEHSSRISKKFKIMSVFQWTERKNWSGLLKAYYRAFNGQKDTVLILKSYRSSTSESQRSIIKQDIEDLKFSMKLNEYPEIFFVGDIISTEELMSMMKSSDIFFLIPRSEGFGLPLAEASACGLPIISSNYGAVPEIVPTKEFLVDCMDTPVCGMPWISNYEATQTWGEPNIIQASEMLKDMHMIWKFHPQKLKELSEISLRHSMNFAPELIGETLYKIICNYI